MYGSQFSFYGGLTFGSQCASLGAASFGASLFGLAWFGYQPQPSQYGLGYFGLNCYGAPLPSPAPSFRFPIGMTVYGKLGKPEWPDPHGVFGIYQRRKMKTGKGYIKMKFYTPRNPRTEPQQANRAKFAAAVAAWGGLTDEQKAAYTARARREQLFGWNLFIREYFAEN